MIFSKKKNNPTLKQQQLKAIAEIGSILKKTRQDKQISLKIISEKTCISKRLLNAIEEGNLDILPPGIYTQGFIRRFAQNLDLDGIDLSQSFPVDSEVIKSESPSWWKFRVFQLRSIHLYFFYILVVSLSVKGLSTALERSLIENNGVSIASVEETIIETKNNPSLVQNISNTPENNSLNNINSGNLSVEIHLEDESWLKIVVDGKTEFEGELPKGTHRTWNAKQELTVRTGNAGGVLVALNDQQAQKLGQPGQIQEVTYKAPNP